jgi:hypothetical protein
MAEIVFSGEDLNRIEEAISDLDPSTHELIVIHEGSYSQDDWAFIIKYVTERLSAALKLGLMARCLGIAAEEAELADERGVQHFIDSKAWVHNFGIASTADEYFQALSTSGGGRLSKALDALIEIAQDRLFGTLDDEYQRLFSSGA